MALRAHGNLRTDGPPSTYALRIEPGTGGRARTLVPRASMGLDDR